MKSQVYVFLKIGRDPENPSKYSVSNPLSVEESKKDLGSYDLDRLLYELGDLKRVVLEGKVKVTGIRIDRSLTEKENMFFTSLDDVVEFFEDVK